MPGEAEPMGGKTGASSVIIASRKKPVSRIVIRAYPRTGEDPTPAQRACRIAFGLAAKRAKGIKYAGKGEGLPPAAEIVANSMAGLTFEPHKVKVPLWVERLSQRLRLTEEERAALERIVLSYRRT
jgi:hypothetical protein